MKTHVIILAQGQQKRLPNLPVAKQLLPLPACGNTPILHRTIRQCWNLLAPHLDPATMQPDAGGHIGVSAIPHCITVVSWLPVTEGLMISGVPVSSYVTPDGATPTIYYPDICTLPDPGNSSLRGIDRYLRQAADERTRAHYERTVVLLGDVVYSWAALGAIFAGTHWGMGFVGTTDIGPAGGELWGISWNRNNEHPMYTCLANALTKHPSFTEYQCGQMRRWLWEIDKLCTGRTPRDPQYVPPVSDARRTWFRAIDDYTRDIDLPVHVEQLGDLALRAAADDLANGMAW